MIKTEKINDQEVVLISESRVIHKRASLEMEKKSIEERLLLINELLGVFK